MELKSVEHSNKIFNAIQIQPSARQANDTPQTDAQSSLSSNASCEGCLGQILNLLKDFIDWIASFFCLSEEEKDLQEFKEIFIGPDAAPENVDPLDFIKTLVGMFQNILPEEAINKRHPNALSYMIHMLEKIGDELKGNKAADLFLTVGKKLLENSNLDEELIFQKFESQGIPIDAATKNQLQDLIGEFNERQAFFKDPSTFVVNRYNSEEENALFDTKDGSLALVKEMIEGYQNSDDEIVQKLGEPALPYILHILEKNSAIKKTKLHNFYLIVGRELLETGKLNEEEILNQCKPHEDFKEQLLKVIHEFNNREQE